MKPKKFKLFHPDDIGQYTQLTLRDVEKVNPLEYFSAQFIRASIVAERDKLVHQGFPLSEELITETLLAKASLEWDQKLKTLLALPTPDVIVDTLNEKKSSSQEAILKNLTLSNDHIIAFILNAGKKGFVFSQYRVEKPIQDPKPQFSYATKVFTAKFLDKKDAWLCFVTSYACTSNTQTCYGYKPTLHFSSTTCGLTRMGVLFDLQKGILDSSVFKEIHFSWV